MARSTLISALAALLAALAVAVSGAAAAPSAYETGVLADNPLVYYRMADTGPLPTFPDMSDASSHGKHGQYRQSGITLGQSSAIAPDAGSDSSVASDGAGRIALVDVPDLATGDLARTIEAWYKSATPTQVSRQAIAGWGNSGGGGTAFSMQVEGNKLWVDIGFAQGYFLVTGNIQDGEWHHLALSYDPSASEKYAGYVDGARLSALTLPPEFPLDPAAPLNTSSSALEVGNWVGMHVNGSLDELAIYGTALSADKIASRHAQAAGGDCAGAPEPADNEATTCVTADVVSQFAVRVEPAAVSFGNVVSGRKAFAAQDVAVENNDPESGYQLSVRRTAFTPSDLSLGIACQVKADFGIRSCSAPAAPAGGQLVWDLALDETKPIAKGTEPVTPIGHRVSGLTGVGQAADKWPVRLDLDVPAGTAVGRYSAVITYSAVVFP